MGDDNKLIMEALENVFISALAHGTDTDNKGALYILLAVQMINGDVRNWDRVKEPQWMELLCADPMLLTSWEYTKKKFETGFVKTYKIYDYCGCSICKIGGVCNYRTSSIEQLTDVQAEELKTNKYLYVELV